MAVAYGVIAFIVAVILSAANTDTGRPHLAVAFVCLVLGIFWPLTVAAIVVALVGKAVADA